MLEKAAQTLRIDSTSDLLAKIGSADISSRDVVQAVYPDLPAQKEPDVESRRAVVGLKHGQGFERAPCCQPLPGNASSACRGRDMVYRSILSIAKRWVAAIMKAANGWTCIGPKANTPPNIR